MVTQARTQLILAVLKIARCLFILAVPVAAWNFWRGVPEASVPRSLGAGPTTSSAQPTSVTHAFDWYAPLWQRDLKQLPFPPEVSAAPQLEDLPPGPVPKLVATFVDATSRYAHFRDSEGKIRFRSLSEIIDRYRIQTIEPGRVELRHGDARVWVEVEKPKEP